MQTIVYKDTKGVEASFNQVTSIEFERENAIIHSAETGTHTIKRESIIKIH